MQNGKLNVDLNATNLSNLTNSLERSALTLAIAIITGAFTLGIAPWLTSSTLTIFGIPIFQSLSVLVVIAGVFLLALRMRK
nr:hypothetical protein [Budvicia aquatica]